MEVKPDHQKLIFKGKHLPNDKSMEELKIKNEDCFVLMILKKKPKVKPKVTTPVTPPPAPVTQNTPVTPTP